MNNRFINFLTIANNERYGIGAFNFSDLETLKVLNKASMDTKSPIIASISEGAFNFFGKDYLKTLIAQIKDQNKYICFHLDHGKSFDFCKQAIECGFDSVMIDFSNLSFEENIKLTHEVVEYAHLNNVAVEAELGTLKGIEDNIESSSTFLTDPNEAINFVKHTEIDALAISIGTSHGAYKHSGKVELDFDRLSKIKNNLVDTPLVLHGASNINLNDVEKFNNFGGKLNNTSGVNKQDIIKSISLGICKINTDTDLRINQIASIREFLYQNPSNYNPRDLIKFVNNNLYNLIISKIELYKGKVI